MGKPVIGRAVAAGMFRHGITAQGFERFWNDLLNRPSGPMRFRFIPQPSMAATDEGVQDARTSHSPYFWVIVDNLRGRMGRLREGLTTTARLILLGLTMDVYQFMVFNTFCPAEALIVALVFYFVPYLVIRGRGTRFAERQYAGWDPVTVPSYTWAMPERACGDAALRGRSA